MCSRAEAQATGGAFAVCSRAKAQATGGAFGVCSRAKAQATGGVFAVCSRADARATGGAGPGVGCDDGDCLLLTKNAQVPPAPLLND
jgi:hypothetical protein